MTLREKANFSECFKMKHKYNNKTYSKNTNYSNGSNKPVCFACAQSGHNFRECKFKQYKCKICSTIGHIAAACKQNNKGNNKKSVHVLETEVHSDREECEEYSLFNLATNALEKNKFKIGLLTNGTHILYEIDIGASVSVISDRMYTQYFRPEYGFKDV